ncbi:MAG: HD domain-containing protein [Candidatus Bathyarchaeota archaeon]|jgi:putative hydrolase of HD superfamily|nr:HD domain-containing protein [Candidatus Bathyarchaeota archaeon]
MSGNMRFQKQIEFILEIDKLKQVFRQTFITDKSRQENSAEHSWHIAIMAILLSEYVKGPQVDVFRVVKMLLIHDLVEIDAGDTFCYDDKACRSQNEREQKAAKRIFNLLPEDQAQELRSLWKEFEACNTPTSRFANALDRLQPLINNYFTDGIAWQKNGVKSHQIAKRNYKIAEGAPKLGFYAAELIRKALARGILKD